MHAVQPEHVVPATAERRGAAVQDQVHVVEVGRHERSLQAPVEGVHQGLHLLRDTRRDSAVHRLINEVRRREPAPELRQEARRNGQRRDDPT
jgi:hypothetical protein